MLPPAPPLLLQIAKRQGVVNPENTFFSVKRFIGRKMGEVGDESKQVGAALLCAAAAGARWNAIEASEGMDNKLQGLDGPLC
jgi:molecular chaperone DnaK (HSP70)